MINSQTVDQFWREEKVKGSIIHLHVCRFIHFFLLRVNNEIGGGCEVFVKVSSRVTVRAVTDAHGRQEETMDVSEAFKAPICPAVPRQMPPTGQRRPPSRAVDVVVAGTLLPSCGWFWVTGRAGRADKFRRWPEGISGMWLIPLQPTDAQMLHNAANPTHIWSGVTPTANNPESSRFSPTKTHGPIIHYQCFGRFCLEASSAHSYARRGGFWTFSASVLASDSETGGGSVLDCPLDSAKVVSERRTLPHRQ